MQPPEHAAPGAHRQNGLPFFAALATNAGLFASTVTNSRLPELTASDEPLPLHAAAAGQRLLMPVLLSNAAET
jgi:hypothetical protein